MGKGGELNCVHACYLSFSTIYVHCNVNLQAGVDIILLVDTLVLVKNRVPFFTYPSPSIPLHISRTGENGGSP